MYFEFSVHVQYIYNETCSQIMHFVFVYYMSKEFNKFCCIYTARQQCIFIYQHMLLLCIQKKMAKCIYSHNKNDKNLLFYAHI